MSDGTLFPGFEAPEPEPVEELSAGQRLTRRQQQDVSNGRHPLTGGPLHPEASTMRSPETAGRRDPFSCGSCVFRDPRGYAKCVLPNPATGRPWPTRVSHSARSDVRAWWPACVDYVPSDPEHLLDTKGWPSRCSCGEEFEGSWWRVRLDHVAHVTALR